MTLDLVTNAPLAVETYG